MTFREEEKDRIIAALETIAENTKPKDVDNAQVIAERDRNAQYIKALAKFIEDFSYELEERMENPDLTERSKGVRNVISDMRKIANQFKPPETRQ